MAQEIRDAETIKARNKGIIDEFRANNGRASGEGAVTDLLLLGTTGAKSGEPRLSPLAFFRVGGSLTIVGSFAGSDANPAWVHNLRANPSAHVEIGSESFDVTAHELPSADRDALIRRLPPPLAASFADLQAKTTRVIPLFELQPAE